MFSGFRASSGRVTTVGRGLVVTSSVPGFGSHTVFEPNVTQLSGRRVTGKALGSAAGRENTVKGRVVSGVAAVGGASGEWLAEGRCGRVVPRWKMVDGNEDGRGDWVVLLVKKFDDEVGLDGRVVP